MAGWSLNTSYPLIPSQKMEIKLYVIQGLGPHIQKITNNLTMMPALPLWERVGTTDILTLKTVCIEMGKADFIFSLIKCYPSQLFSLLVSTIVFRE